MYVYDNVGQFNYFTVSLKLYRPQATRRNSRDLGFKKVLNNISCIKLYLLRAIADVDETQTHANTYLDRFRTELCQVGLHSWTDIIT